MMTDKNVVCVYHHPCMDGFTSAWVFRKFLLERNGYSLSELDEHVTFYKGRYDDKEVPWWTESEIYLLDFCYPKPVLERMLQEGNFVTIIDHHRTAPKNWEGLEADYPNLKVVFDLHYSGAGLTWMDFFPRDPMPALVEYVQDRDLWNSDLLDSREVNSWINSWPLTFDNWTRMNMAMNRPSARDDIVTEGRAITRQRDKDLNEILSEAIQYITIGGHKNVPICNLPYMFASDGAGKLALGQPFGASYYDKGNVRVWSLRSTKDAPQAVDVSAIAASFGGGGHFNAAGFNTSKDWLGDNHA